MIVYLIGFIFTILLVYISEYKVKSKKSKTVLRVIAVLPLLIISAIRYNVGTDYDKRYVQDYINLSNGIDVSNLEIGFKAIDYICLLFTKETFLLFIVTSIIILSIIFEVIYKKSTNKVLSIVIFFFGGYFFGTLNLVRQYIAVVLIMLGYQFLTSENKKKAYIGFIICAILAFLMHSSSIICFAILFFNKKNLVSIKWVIPVSIFVLILNQNIMKILTPIIENTRFNVYLIGKFAGGELSLLTIIENFAVYIFMYSIYYYYKKNNKNIEKEGITYLNIQGLALLCTVAGVIHMQFLRIAIYFWIFQILSIPYYLEYVPYEKIADLIETKFNKKISINTVKNAVYSLVIIGFIAIFIYTNVLNNDNGVIPYQTIFSKGFKIK